jgi:hypothetical protein
MEYTEKQRGAMWQAQKDFHRTGAPEKAQRVALMMENEHPYQDIMSYVEGGQPTPVKPEIATADLPPVPDYTGNKATNSAWRSFAKKVSDMEPEVIDDLGRTDIIKILSDKGIIPAPE